MAHAILATWWGWLLFDFYNAAHLTIAESPARLTKEVAEQSQSITDNSVKPMPHPLVEKAKAELEQAQAQLESALRAWDASVSELWRTSLGLTQAQRRVTHAHELLRDALESVELSQKSWTTETKSASRSEQRGRNAAGRGPRDRAK
jgi:exonuclease VII small subunit